jgi:hypothetical protein
MITIAALAWKRMGRSDFARYVFVLESPFELTLPTVRIKMTPWTAAEVAELSAFLAPPEAELRPQTEDGRRPVGSEQELCIGAFLFR